MTDSYTSWCKSNIDDANDIIESLQNEINELNSDLIPLLLDALEEDGIKLSWRSHDGGDFTVYTEFIIKEYKYKYDPDECNHRSWYDLDTPKYTSTHKCADCGSEIDVWVTHHGYLMDPRYHKALVDKPCNCCNSSIPLSQIRR